MIFYLSSSPPLSPSPLKERGKVWVLKGRSPFNLPLVNNSFVGEDSNGMPD
jgi:hypothetical protein